MIRLKLHPEELNGILHALGELPTKTGAWELAQKIKAQAEPQIEDNEESEPEEAAE
jgi:hypothetical protein